TSTKNFTLQIGESKTVVEVSGAAATIDTTTAQVQTTFESKQMADLPTMSVGSGVLNLSLYTAGVSSSGAVGVGTGPSVGGQRPRNNNFTIEGVDNNSKSVTGPLASIPNDAVSEFSILQNQFFFFGDYEYNPVGYAGSGGQIFAPTQAGYATLAAIPGISTTNLEQLQKYLPPQATAVDPTITPNGEFPVVGGKQIPLGQYS